MASFTELPLRILLSPVSVTIGGLYRIGERESQPGVTVSIK